MNIPECNEIDESEARVATHEEFTEQIRSYLVPLTEQLDDLTQLIERMSPTKQSNTYPRGGKNASFIAASYQPQICFHWFSLFVFFGILDDFHRFIKMWGEKRKTVFIPTQNFFI